MSFTTFIGVVMRSTLEPESPNRCICPPKSHVAALSVNGGAIPSPIQMLPNELLIVIFDETRDRLPSEGQCRSLEIISHVSHHWRQLAFSVPYFWTDLVIKLEQPLERLAAYLERSQQCSLNITIESCTAVPDVKTLVVLDMIAKHRDRWRQFVLKPNEDTDTGLISSYLSRCPAPQLQCLRLFLPFDPPSLTTPLPWFWFRFCSRLSTLELYIHRLQARPSVAEFRGLVEASPFLKNLTMVGEVLDLSPDHGHSAIEIPYLVSLSIGTGSAENEYFSLLLGLLSTPSLEALELWSLDEEGWDVFRESVDVRSKKYPLLKSLALIEVDFGSLEDEIGTWLVSAFSMLQHLTLLEDEDERQENFNDTVVRFLRLLSCPVLPQDQPSLPLRSPTVWPDLRKLTISYTHDNDLLHDVLSSRLARGHPISVL